MFSNVFDETLYIQEVVDPSTNKHYNAHITMTVQETSPLAGMTVCDFYLTTSDPHCGLLVQFGAKAYFSDEFDTKEELLLDLNKRLEAALPDGFKRYEAIVAHGLKGNELNF